MGDRSVQQRLAAVLAADVSGYTRRMEQDSAGTVAAWQDAREDVIKPQVAEYSGNIVKLTGDGFLVEFPTVQNAVRCAIAMLEGLASSSLDFRMGINLGDIIDDGEDIHGEGVNIAARIEALADEGGINISGGVYDQVKNRIEANYEDQGEQEVKNVSDPVRVYSIRLDRLVAVTVPVEQAIDDKPSIAVLPFDNLSGDPDQDFIGDGLTEDIIAGLSRIRFFFVIARNSTFQYKGTSPDIRRVAEELGVRYVLEGSVRKAGDRIRVTAQLIDARSNNHIWAERYDRNYTDIFAVQDEITGAIVGQLEPELGRAEYERVKSEPPENLDAWALFHRAAVQIYRMRPDAGEGEQTRRLFQQALDRDPNFALAHAGVSWSHVHDFFGNAASPDLEEAIASARRAVELDDTDPFAHCTLGVAYIADSQIERGIPELKDALRINANFARAHEFMGFALMHNGNAADAIKHLQLGILLSPADPWLGLYYNFFGRAYLYLEEYEKSVEWSRKAIEKNAFWPPYAVQTAALAHLGRLEEARAARMELEKLLPTPTIEFVKERTITVHQPYTDILFGGLRKAELPEHPPAEAKPDLPPLPDKPSIAVLPFDNLSGDPEQEYFSDGITEDIITALSRIRQFFVIARNTTFTYKGQAVDVQAIAKDLGVRYVLEGSVRKAGNRVRISAQLIDGNTGNHLWAESYDRNMDDIFTVQDEITLTVVGAIEPELSRAEQDRARQKPPENLGAWDFYHRGLWHMWQFDPGNLRQAINLHTQATELDPNFSNAFAACAYVHACLVIQGDSDDPAEELEAAVAAARKARAIDEKTPYAYWAMAVAKLFRRDFESAIEECESANESNPSFSPPYMTRGMTLVLSGRYEEAIPWLGEAIRLSPKDPLTWVSTMGHALAYYFMGQYEEAEIWGKKAARFPKVFLWVPATYAAILAQLGRLEEAHAQVDEIKKVNPAFSVGFVRRTFPADKAGCDLLIDGLRRAGVAES